MMAGRTSFNPISDRASQLADKLLSKVPKERLFHNTIKVEPPQVVYVPVLSAKLRFDDTDTERKALYQAGRKYRELFPRNPLLAHGTLSTSSMCQILLDMELRHTRGIVNYGRLGTGDDTQIGGHWDLGWGLFIIKAKTFKELPQNNPVYNRVPLAALEVIVFPQPIVEAVRTEFPQHAHKIKSYSEYADELNSKIQRPLFVFFRKTIEFFYRCLYTVSINID